jgi:hypothetical protein
MRGSGRLRGVLAFGLSMLAAGVLRSSGAAGAAGPPALMLILGSYVQAGWHAASIRMWVRGGGCATRPVVVPGTITRPGRGGQREMVPSLEAMSFGRLIRPVWPVWARTGHRAS